MSEIPAWAAALGRIPSGVFVITAGCDMAATGMLASWVQQCCFSPPLITMAINRERYLAKLLTPQSPVIVNVIAAGHTRYFTHFGKGFAPGDDAFKGVETHPGESGLPILADSLAHVECEVVHQYTAGDHDIFVAKVLHGSVHGEGTPSVHIRKSGLHY